MKELIKQLVADVNNELSKFNAAFSKADEVKSEAPAEEMKQAEDKPEEMKAEAPTEEMKQEETPDATDENIETEDAPKYVTVDQLQDVISAVNNLRELAVAMSKQVQEIAAQPQPDVIEQKFNQVKADKDNKVYNALLAKIESIRN